MQTNASPLAIIGRKYGFDIDLSGKHDMLCELAWLKSDYLQEVVLNLDRVLSGEISTFEFGYDATIIEFYQDVSIIQYDFFNKFMEADSSLIYGLMNDWYRAVLSQKTTI